MAAGLTAHTACTGDHVQWRLASLHILLVQETMCNGGWPHCTYSINDPQQSLKCMTRLLNTCQSGTLVDGYCCFSNCPIAVHDNYSKTTRDPK